MSRQVKVVLNKAAVRDQLLKSEWIANICQEEARKIAQRAGSGYETDMHTGRNRVNSSVYAATAAANRDNLKNNTLLKSVGSGK